MTTLADEIAALLLKALACPDEDLERRLEAGDATHPGEHWYDEVPERERRALQRTWTMQRAREARAAARVAAKGAR